MATSAPLIHSCTRATEGYKRADSTGYISVGGIQYHFTGHEHCGSLLISGSICDRSHLCFRYFLHVFKLHTSLASRFVSSGGDAMALYDLTVLQ
jgi:hypothetical protein